MSVTIDLKPEVQARLLAQAQRDGVRFEDYLARLLEQAAPENQDQALVDRIRHAVPPAVQKRFSELVTRRRAETLTPQQHTELLHLTDQIEEIDAERLGWLVELSHLRGIPLTEIVQQLELTPIRHD